MSKPQLPSKRHCAICGQEKPLIAFLQQGGGYGSICATCKIDSSGDGSDESGSSSRSYKYRLDDKAIVQAEIELKKKVEERTVSDTKVLEKRYALAEEKKNKKDEIATAEKKHRENYIKKELTPTDDQQTEKKKAQDTNKKRNAEASFINSRKYEQITLQQIQSIEKENHITNDVDLTAPFTGPQIGFAKIHNPHFLKWLKSSALLKTSPSLLNTFEKNAMPPSPDERQKQQSLQTDNKKTSTEAKPRDPLFANPGKQQSTEPAKTGINDIEKSFGPSPRK